MDELTNNEFIEFIESHEKFYKEVTEISKNDNGNPLIENTDFKMYSLDEMCWDCELLEDNTPKTTDALWYKQDSDGNLTLYVIEFKFHNFNDPNAKDMLNEISREVNTKNDYECLSNRYKKYLRKINNYYGDEVEFSLILKPIESLNVVIPALYEQYCMDNGHEKKDIRKYLQNVEKKLVVFVSHYDEVSIHSDSKQRLQSMDVGLEENYERLEQGKLIDSHNIYASYQFNYFLLMEQIH